LETRKKEAVFDMRMDRLLLHRVVERIASFLHLFLFWADGIFLESLGIFKGFGRLLDLRIG
jgi:hypothetical protein